MATATLPSPRPVRSGQPTPLLRRPSLAEVVQSKGNGLPNRLALHTITGFGKTSFGAMCPKPIFIQSKGETGLETLIDAGRLPETPHFPECQDWTEYMSYLDAVLEDDHDRKTLVIDTINGVEKLSFTHTTARDYKNAADFQSFSRGQKAVALSDWPLMLAKLDAIRMQRRMSIVVLAHTKVKNFKNPEGADYDRYQPDMADETWALTDRWADITLFGNFSTTVTDVSAKGAGAKKGKGTGGGTTRVIYTERTAAFDAKNRIGLPPEIDLGYTPEEGWRNFLSAVKEAKAANRQEQEQQQAADLQSAVTAQLVETAVRELEETGR